MAKMEAGRSVGYYGGTLKEKGVVLDGNGNEM